VNAGILSEDEAKSHPLKNVVTRALGGAAHVSVDLIEVPTQAGDRFLLCSDGLTGMIADEEIIEALGAAGPLEKTVRSLVDIANDRGGVDNITAILVEVRGEKAEDSRSKKAAAKKPRASGESTAVTLETSGSRESVDDSGKKRRA
jgi:protein phosphatase